MPLGALQISYITMHWNKAYILEIGQSNREKLIFVRSWAYEILYLGICDELPVLNLPLWRDVEDLSSAKGMLARSCVEVECK